MKYNILPTPRYLTAIYCQRNLLHHAKSNTPIATDLLLDCPKYEGLRKKDKLELLLTENLIHNKIQHLLDFIQERKLREKL